MGASLGSEPGRARGGRNRRRPMSEINVTPFVGCNARFTDYLYGGSTIDEFRGRG